MTVASNQRFTADHPCPICGGHDDASRGKGERCYGFLSGDGHYAHCTRAERAGAIRQHEQSQTYAHKLTGPCRCGVQHGADVARVNGIGRNGHAGRSGVGRIAAIYPYEDERGRLVSEVVRYTGPKGFRQRRPDGRGGSEWNLNGVLRLLYRLPGLLAADPASLVYVPEGEKDVDRLRELGLVATCNPGGAGKWKPEYGEPLRGRRVVILADNDDEGRKHAQKVAGALVGVAASVRLLELPDMPEHGDVSDWLDAGGTRERLTSLSQLVPEWAPASDAKMAKGAEDGQGRNDGHLRESWPSSATSLAAVRPEETTWLWRGRIPYGKLTVLDGDPGLGKSVMTLDIAARVTTGRPMPDGVIGDLDGPGGVLLLSAEDGLADTIKPRLLAAGADVSRVFALETVTVFDDEGNASAQPPIIPGNLPEIEREIRGTRARLVIIDPLVSYLGETVNSHRDQEIRRALAPLAAVAGRTGAAIWFLRHLNKGSAANPLYRGGGSIGIVGAARSGLIVAKDPDDSTGARRVLASVKCNLAAPPASLAYHLEAVHVDGLSDAVVRVAWEGHSAHSAARLLAIPAGGEKPSAQADAETFLRDALSRGPQTANDVLSGARKARISEKTLRRAKAALGVEAEKEKESMDGPWLWMLPPDPPKMATGAEDGQSGDDGHLQGGWPSSALPVEAVVTREREVAEL